MINTVSWNDNSAIFPENKLPRHSKRGTVEGEQFTWLDIGHSCLGGGTYVCTNMYQVAIYMAEQLHIQAPVKI